MKLYKLQKEIIGLAVFYVIFTVFFVFTEYGIRNPISIYSFIASWFIIPFLTYKIEVGSNTVEFCSLFRKSIVEQHDIISVENATSHYKLHYKGGSLIISPFIEDQQELITFLSSLCPEKYNKSQERTE